jgi:hypothetical protein
MGTSVSQRSPSTPNWRVVDTGYINDDVTIDRLVQEIFRAAANQPEGNLLQDLSEPIMAECLRIVERANTHFDAIQQFRQALISSGQTSLAAEIAQRAIVLTFQSTEDRTSAFVHSLFSEAGNYLVSRDLSGFIGSGRLSNISDSIAFKNSIRQQISKKVGEVSPPAKVLSKAILWREYVNQIVNHIVRGV